MSTYKFDPSLVQGQTLAAMQGYSEQISGDLRTMESTVEARLSEWNGRDRQMYFDAKAQWNAAAMEMPRILQEAHQALMRISAEIEAAEQHGQQLWASGMS
jgi:WXG100 family type VII secretion target